MVEPRTFSTSDVRFCDHCKHEHGILYLCPHYPEEVKAQIRADDATYRKALANFIPKTDDEARAHAIFKWFAAQEPE